MKEIVVISGKGGTGKTSIVAGLASLAEKKIMTDCDVDASDLHLILSPVSGESHAFSSGVTAKIDKKECIACERCIKNCRFKAVSADFIIDPFACEGCGVCAHFCPADAISLTEKNSGEWFVSETRHGTMVHARLAIAEGNSGKLVSLVRKEANKIAEEEGSDLIITDGSPGIGCPVIASITGANLVLIVTEPSVSGIHDMQRIIELSAHFKIQTMVCINKHDLNNENTGLIEQYCKDNNIEIAARIPYDTDFVKAQIQRKSIIEYSNSRASQEIKNMWEKILHNMYHYTK